MAQGFGESSLLAQLARALEHLVRACAHTVILGEVAPADGAGAVDQELRRAGDVRSLDAGAFVEEVVLPDDDCVAVGEDRERVSRLTRQLA